MRPFSSKGNILIKGVFFLLIFAAGFFIFFKSPLKNNVVELFPPDAQKNAQEKIGEIFNDAVKKVEDVYSNIPSPLPTPTPGGDSSESRPSDSSGETVNIDANFFVKPYLIYPADKSLPSAYEKAVKDYLKELHDWYKGKVSKTFRMADLKVIKSTYDYLTMRCGLSSSPACLNDPSKLEGNWGMYMNLSIHDGAELWEEKTAALVFGAGGGGYAGANQYGNFRGFAIVGDWVLEPISGVPNTWGIPCSYSDGWQCSGGVPKGSPAHELGHAFGLPHPGAQYASQSIMQWHGNYPTVGFIEQEIEFLRSSPFFK